VNDVPLFAFAALLLAQAVAEWSIMLHTGSLKRKHKREWTYYAVAFPFKAMLGASIVEFILLRPRPAPIVTAAGGLLAAAGIAIRVLGHLQLAGAFSPYVEKSENQTLVQSGMYAKVRHPMYVGTILLFVGMPLIVAAKWAWLFSALGLLGLIFRIRKEEAFLIRELPGYREYTQQTWRLVPHIY
jgi:protein-S-isoprenylcysteine O-methyltransferase Ste14